MGYFGETNAGYVWVWDRSGGDSLGNYVPPHKREERVTGHWTSRSFVEDVLSRG